MTEPVLVNAPAASDNRRVVKMGAIGGVLVLAILVLPKLFGGGGGGGADTALTPTPAAPPSSAAPTAGGGGGGESVSVGGGSVRNPFAALIDDTTGGDAATATPVANVTDTGSLPMPVLDTGSGGDTGSGVATAPPTTLPPRQTHRFFLLEVYTTQTGASGARVRIDDDVMEVVVGPDFGGNYRAVTLDRQSGCGVFLFGDRRFTLCEGQETQT